MSDLIRREDALKALLKLPCKIDSDNYTWIRLSDAFGTVDEDVPSAEPERIIKIGQRSGKTLESAIDYLHSTGWLQEHDRILTESAERKKGEWVDGLPYVNSHWWVCSICHVSAPENHTGYNFCPNCGADLRGE